MKQLFLIYHLSTEMFLHIYDIFDGADPCNKLTID